jgi:hypothetical protein
MSDHPEDIARIAMWSGPRNISTAMMRAFENRPDCVVWDEPFYAAELARSGRDHPMRDEVIAAGETDPAEIVARLLGPIDDPDKPGATVFYQKHMTHHMLDGFDRAWIARVRNAFLIRDPVRVLASYTRAWSDVTLADIGYVQQSEIFDAIADRLGQAPPVIESADVLADPRGMIHALCVALKIPFREDMLSWPAGRRKSDGVWAPVWYAAVERSTGFAAPSPDAAAPVTLPPALQRIADAARPHYERLARFRLIAPSST